MRPPLLLQLAVLAFWGFQTDLLIWGLLMGGLLEGSRWLPNRWELEAQNFRRLWNVSILLLLGAGLYLFVSTEGPENVREFVRDPARAGGALRSASQALLRWLQWLPLVFFPFVLVHAGSRTDRLPWWTVTTLLSRKRPGIVAPAVSESSSPAGFHPAYPFLLIALFAASADYRHARFYFPTLAVLLIWMLWPERSRRFAWPTWAATMAMILGLAYAGQWGLLWMFRQLEGLENRWVNQLANPEFSAQGVMTDLGAVGRRKTSGRIVLRVTAPGDSPPALLREAVFTQFRSPYWSATRKDFQPVLPPPDQRTWRLARAPMQRRWVTVERYTRGGAATLPLPDGAFEVHDLRADSVETNRLTAARIDGADNLVAYTVHYDRGTGFDAAPDDEDRNLIHLRDADREAVQNLALELGLAALDPPAMIQRLDEFFLENFQYTLDRPAASLIPGTNSSALAEFLFTDRRGHCEYFATATTLLLRAANIPARYVVGHSVQERQGNQFIVRARHAHAWSLAFVNGAWRSVDTTPSNWFELEAHDLAFWESWYDRMSAAWRAFVLWRQGESPWRLYVLIAGFGVLAFMAWRELQGGRWRGTKRAKAGAAATPFGPGRDSEFYALEKLLARRHAPRLPAEALGTWIGRLKLTDDQANRLLRRLLALHYRLRFDPAGLPDVERGELRTAVGRWLDRRA